MGADLPQTEQEDEDLRIVPEKQYSVPTFGVITTLNPLQDGPCTKIAVEVCLCSGFNLQTFYQYILRVMGVIGVTIL